MIDYPQSYLADVIRKYRRDNHPNADAEVLASAIGFTPATLYSFLKGKRKAQARTTSAVIDFLSNKGLLTNALEEISKMNAPRAPEQPKRKPGEHMVSCVLDDLDYLLVLNLIYESSIYPYDKKVNLIGKLFPEEFPLFKT